MPSVAVGKFTRKIGAGFLVYIFVLGLDTSPLQVYSLLPAEWTGEMQNVVIYFGTPKCITNQVQESKPQCNEQELNIVAELCSSTTAVLD